MKSRVTTFLLLAAFLLSSPAMARQSFYGQVLTAAVASGDVNSAAIDATNALYGSAQCIWTSLTGTLNATLALQVSNDNGSTWDPISGASLTISSANGHNTISISGVLTEQKVRVAYAHVGVSGGTLSCYLSLKE